MDNEPKRTGTPAKAVSEKVLKIQKLSAKVGGEKTTLFALERTKVDGSINQIFGLPCGVSDEKWPRNVKGEPMVHILTLDLLQAPGVGSIAARAVALFLDNPDTNEALFQPDPDFAKIVYLTEADISRGVITTKISDPKKALYFSATRIDVPTAIFSMWGGDEDPSEDLQNLDAELGSLPGFAGPRSTSIEAQDYVVDHKGRFILQFNESLVPINLGDAGTMFVFDDVAFYVGQ